MDVAARRALERGAEVVFVDNRPRGVGGDGDLDAMLLESIELAAERAGPRLSSAPDPMEQR